MGQEQNTEGATSGLHIAVVIGAICLGYAIIVFFGTSSSHYGEGYPGDGSAAAARSATIDAEILSAALKGDYQKVKKSLGIADSTLLKLVDKNIDAPICVSGHQAVVDRLKDNITPT